MLENVNANVREKMKELYEGTLKVAMDVGKSDTKVVCGEEGNIEGISFKFPSIISHPNDLTIYSEADLFSCSLITDTENGKNVNRTYFVGKTGCKIHTTDDNAKDGRGATKENNHDKEIAILCACLAICMAMKNHDIHTANIKAAMGMSIVEFAKYKKDKAGLLGYFTNILPVNKEITCSYKGENYIFTIVLGEMYPETLSAYFYGRSTINDTGLILVDIGGNNIQYVLSDDTGISNDASLTFTDKHGVNEFLDDLLIAEESVDAINTRAVSKTRLKNWLTGTETNPLTGEKLARFNKCFKERAKAYLAENVNDVFYNRYKDFIDYGYKKVYTGGGSVLFRDILGEENLLPDGEYANVKGFYGFIR